MDLPRLVKKRIRNRKVSIVFAESEDIRVLRAASYLVNNEICGATLIGQKENIVQHGLDSDIHLPDSIQFTQFTAFPHKDRLLNGYCFLNKKKGITREEAEEAMEHPLYFGASLVANEYANGCVAGSIATTPEVIRAALKCIGLSKKSSIVSSTFLMDLPDGKTVTYADCGVVPYPDKQQLADIAIDSARTHQTLTGEEPSVAMLSFSTKGSARHESVDLVLDALTIVKNRAPDLIIDGELQFDAALLPEVAHRKAPESSVAGKANVFIFPNLDAGNIAYKITERLGKAEATGPILQGLNKPMMDLSRGCNWMDVVNAACVAILIGAQE